MGGGGSPFLQSFLESLAGGIGGNQHNQLPRLMKQKLKNFARRLSNKPLIGPLIRLGIIVLRFPAHYTFLTQQLPQLLENTSKLQHQMEDRENFARTAPRTLRQLTRDVANVRRTLDQMQAAAGADKRQMEHLAKACPSEGAYLSVDGQVGSVGLLLRPAPGRDALSVLDEASFAKGTLNSITVKDALDSVPQEQLVNSVLPQLIDSLCPGGRLLVEFVDAEAVLARATDSESRVPALREALFKAQPGASTVRRNLLGKSELVSILSNAGFVDIRVQDETQVSGQCAILASKEKKQ